MDIYSLPIATMTTTLIKIMTGTLIMVITRVLQTKHTFGWIMNKPNRLTELVFPNHVLSEKGWSKILQWVSTILF